MVIARRTFFCKVGHATQVVELAKQFLPMINDLGLPVGVSRICTDLTGKTDRVIWDLESERFLDPGEIGEKAAQHPDFQRIFGQLAEHIEGAESEYLTLEFSG
jgi:hypothetical protein